MFRNFLRTFFPKKVSRQTVELLTACFDQIRDERFCIVSSQLSEGLLRFERDSDDVFKNYVGFTYRPGLSGKFENPKGRWMRVTGIRLSGLDGKSSDRLSIYVSHGLLTGYAFEGERRFNADPASIDVTDMRIELLDTPSEKLKAIIPKDIQTLINWGDVFDVELDGKTFYHLKDTGDGDFVGINELGTLYMIKHDPPEITQLEGNIEKVFSN